VEGEKPGFRATPGNITASRSVKIRKRARLQMSETCESKASTDYQDDGYELGHYEIRVRGHLDSKWADWFEGLTITLAENGDTLLTGRVVDQAALHGMLRRVRDLGMPLISIVHVKPG
jgi:hypothetical protein